MSSTSPPSAAMRCFSRGRLGLWSSVSRNAFPFLRASAAGRGELLRLAFAQLTCHLVTGIGRRVTTGAERGASRGEATGEASDEGAKRHSPPQNCPRVAAVGDVEVRSFLVRAEGGGTAFDDARLAVPQNAAVRLGKRVLERSDLGVLMHR